MNMDVTDRVTIREARPEDDAVIGDLLVEAFVTQYAKHLPEVVYTDERKRELRAVAAKRAVATVLAAEVDGEVVGTVALFPPGSPGTQSWLPNAADLRHLATSVRFHGTGLARPLLDAIENVARQWGVSTVTLHVRKGANGVMRMYERRGYVRDPSGDLELPTVSLVAFARRLAG
jgi:GNAT superfamily N-acetyltransferase